MLIGENFFYNILTVQLLKVVHVVIHIGNKGNIHIRLKYYDFKISKHPWLCENIKSTYCITCRKQI